jgi:hypothetical protein
MPETNKGVDSMKRIHENAQRNQGILSSAAVDLAIVPCATVGYRYGKECERLTLNQFKHSDF